MLKVEFLSIRDDGEGHFIVDVRKTVTGDGVEPVVSYGIHAFPHDTLEWRAAEYGIDPSDVDTLLDIVLAEPYITNADYEPGTTLYDAPSIDDARAAHISRCAKVKLANRMSTRGKSNPLTEAKGFMPMHPEALALKAELVRRGRENVRQQRFADPDQERVSRLRHELHMHQQRTKR